MIADSGCKNHMMFKRYVLVRCHTTSKVSVLVETKKRITGQVQESVLLILRIDSNILNYLSNNVLRSF